MKAAILAFYNSPFFLYLFPILVWPAITAVVSLFHSKIEPRFPRFVAFLKASGLSLPGVWAVLRSLFVRLPELPVKVAGVFLLFFLPVVVIACNGCGATGISPQTGIAIGEDLGQVTCTILEGIPQTDVTAVQLICSQLPKHGTKGTVKTFRMTVTKAQADALTAPAPGKVSP